MGSNDDVEFYESRRGLLRRKQWRWRVRSTNGNIIATSGESYNNLRDCEDAADAAGYALSTGNRMYLS